MTTLAFASSPASLRKIGRYLPVRQLGVGPDGIAVLARDPSTNEHVELRYLARALRGTARYTEIEQTVQRLAMLEHPAVRAVQDLDVVDDEPVVVLAWAGDASLDARLARGALARAEALSIAERLAHALGAAHRIGLHHGALVPSGVVLRDDGTPALDLTGLRVSPAAAAGSLDAACLAPETGREATDASSDVYGLGAVLHCMLTGRAPGASFQTIEGPLGALLASMLAPDRDARPTAAEVCLEIRRLASARPDTLGAESTPTDPLAAERVSEGTILGRFQLVRRLGAGGMGEVYQAIDLGSGDTVAVKVLHPKYGNDPMLLRRFRKEARVLAEIRNPYVANLLDVNHDRGVHYIAMEFLAGPTVADVQEAVGKLPEREALAIVADVCRALAEPHRRGIIHRDIKPENVMYVDKPADGARGTRVKLCDFGIARQANGGEGTRVTTEGMIVGTPMFMAPEQGAGGPLGPATDVYALGVTLFLLIAGRPPFDSEDMLQLIVKHATEPPPALESVAPEVSAATAALVARALEKDPAKRYADAGEMLEAVEKILRGEPADITVHPQLPPASAKVVTIAFEWTLSSSPEALWPYVSNTDRMNRAVGMPPAKFEVRRASDGAVETVGSNRVAGQNLRWREHPFEWVEGRRWGVLRVLESGLMRWYAIELELHRRPEGGTRLRYTMKYEPRYWFAPLLVGFEVGVRQRAALGRVFQRIDDTVSGKLAKAPEVDAFQPAAALGRAAEEKVARAVAEMRAEGLDATCVEHLASFVRHAPDQEIARLRPLAFARRYGLDAEKFVAVCLHAARRGLLVLLWDVICPLCRIPSDFAESLRAIEDHAHCRACSADFALDFARSIELIFRVAPAVRASETRTYCVGGPAFSPHVAAQVRLRAGERFVLALGLEPGMHRVRSPQLPDALDLRVSPEARMRRLDLRLGDGTRPGAVDLAAGEQVLALTNTLDREMVVRVERLAPREDALTAARAASLPLFRELFPGEVLAPGQLVSVTRVALLVTEVAGAEQLFATLGDARAFELLLRYFRVAGDVVAREGGALLKTVGGGVVAAFEQPLPAARAALALHAALRGEARAGALTLQVAVHAGPAMAATVNDKLDYFGRTANVASRLAGQARPGCVLLSRAVVEEPEVAALLYARGLRGETQALGAVEEGLWGVSVQAAVGGAGEAGAMGQAGVAA